MAPVCLQRWLVVSCVYTYIKRNQPSLSRPPVPGCPFQQLILASVFESKYYVCGVSVTDWTQTDWLGQLIKMLGWQKEVISPWDSFLARQTTSMTCVPPALSGSPVHSPKKIKANSCLPRSHLGFHSFPALAQGYWNIWLRNKNKQTPKQSPRPQPTNWLGDALIKNFLSFCQHSCSFWDWPELSLLHARGQIWKPLNLRTAQQCLDAFD